LSPGTGETQPGESLVEVLLDGIRTRSKNKEVFLEPVDISSPHSLRDFCGKLIKGENRVDGLVFCHEYRSLGSFFSRGASSKKGNDDLEQEETTRRIGSLATFYITTLCLPSLLSAPPDRDIRIVNIVNPFYAAALSGTSFGHFTQTLLPKAKQDRNKTSNTVKEGIRSLRMIVFMRHLQTVLNALPSAPVPNADETPIPSMSFPEEESGKRKGSTSNISVCSVNPGISLSDTVQPLLEPSWMGMILYLLLFPIIFLLSKTSFSALQTVLHVLFVPTRAKLRASELSLSDPKRAQDPASLEEEIRCLVPGGLYANCGVVRVKLPSVPLNSNAEKKAEKSGEKEEDPSDVLGREVWEMMEREIKEWDESEKQRLASSSS